MLANSWFVHNACWQTPATCKEVALPLYAAMDPSTAFEWRATLSTQSNFDRFNRYRLDYDSCQHLHTLLLRCADFFVAVGRGNIASIPQQHPLSAPGLQIA